MLVSFSVANFLSFSSEETFSLVASNRLSGGHEDHTVPIPNSNELVLRAGVLYGANGAGKSNLFKALRYVSSVVLNTRKRNTGTGRKKFRLANGTDETSNFDLQFIVAGKLYRFGFKVDDERITEEWLLQVRGARTRVLYERTTDRAGQVIINARGLKAAGEKVLALAKVGGPQAQSFLATLNVTLDPADCGRELAAILDWFRNGLKLIGPDESFVMLGRFLDQDSNFLTFAGSFLSAVSTGVDHLNIIKQEMSEDDLRGWLPEEIRAPLLRDLAEAEDGTGFLGLGDGLELVVERKGESPFYRIKIQAVHRSGSAKTTEFELAEESDGTRRLLDLMPALYHLHTGSAVCFIDEIDRSLHPMLVRKFFEFFLRSCAGSQRQLIVTTHESNLLDQDLLRRDEIWFAEKDRDSSTRLYSLADFKVRNDLEIRKHYLQGRFGAIPFLGDLDQLCAGDKQPV